MNSLQNLTHAATLKGYLLATKAPKHMVDLAQAIVDTEITRADGRVSNEDARIPATSQSGYIEMTLPAGEELIKSITLPPCTAKTVSINRNAAPETPQGEANDLPVGDVTGEDKDASVSTGGAMLRKIRGGTGHHKLEAAMLPAIKESLKDKTFDAVGPEYGVTGQSIVNFLKRHGVDHKQFKKKTGPGARSAVADDNDDWPAPVKPEKTMSLVAEAKPPAEQPKMKFRKQKVRNTWGHEQEIDVPVPTGKYKDRETGATVTKFAPGYAYGAHEQKNVSVKGGG